MTNFGLKIWDTSLVGSKLSPWLSQISSWACLWNALSLSPQTQQNIYNIWAQSLRFEPETRLKSFHETGPCSLGSQPYIVSVPCDPTQEQTQVWLFDQLN